MQRVLAVIGERVVPRPAPCKFQIVDDKDAKYQWNNVIIICIKGSVTTSLCRFFGQEKKQKHKDLSFICLALNDNDHF